MAAASLLLAALAWSFPAGGPSLAQEARDAGPGFSRYRLLLGMELAEMFAFDLDGDGLKELVVLETERGQSRQAPHFLTVFRQTRSGFAPLEPAAAPLPPHLNLAGMGTFRSGPGLVLLVPGRIVVWPWRAGRFHPEQARETPVRSLFPAPGGSLKTGLNWVRDLDGDGLSELLVPDFSGWSVLREGEEGLVRHARLEMEGESRLMVFFRRRLAAFDLPGMIVFDVDGRGWKDVGLYLNGLLRVFLLDGTPRPEPLAPAAEVDFQPPRPFDPKAPWDPPLALVAGRDLNGDGSFDLIFSKNSASDSQFNTRTTILIHYGRKGAGGAPIDFSRKPDQVYLSEGLTLPFLLDLDGDERTDLVMVNVEIGFWNVIKALITRSVSAEAAFYRMPPEGRYPREPFQLESYDVTFSLGRFGHQPITAFGDLNGDKLPDLLLSVDSGRMGIHWGRPGAVWDDDYDEEWEDAMPLHGKRVRIEDLNGDDREDLLFLYNRDDLRRMPELGHSITVLLSRFSPAGPAPSPAVKGDRGVVSQ